MDTYRVSGGLPYRNGPVPELTDTTIPRAFLGEFWAHGSWQAEATIYEEMEFNYLNIPST